MTQVDFPERSASGDSRLPRLGDVPLTLEREAYLAPLLHALLEDFRKLDELETPDLEPMTVFCIKRWDGDAR